jgi:hypothetical protein
MEKQSKDGQCPNREEFFASNFEGNICQLLEFEGKERYFDVL